MGLALDERMERDEHVEAEGISFIMNPDVAATVRSHGPLFIDYKNSLWIKGFQLTLQGTGSC
jgi:hypothetical protein